MHKCFKCGTEFDGKFCPTCGSKWEEEKVCPECGANLPGEARFCNQCGYSFAEKTANVIKPQSDMPRKVFSALRLVPFAALALFSVLLFAFYAAPVAEMVMGAGFPNVSLGNVYGYSGFISDIPELQGSMIALFIFLPLSVLYSAAMGAIQFLPKFKYKEIKIINRNFPLPLLMGFAANVFYLIFFIIGIAIIGIISSADEGMGLLASGACPILLIVFALLFAALSVGAYVARYLLAKKTPELSKVEEERKNQYIESEKARKEQFYATHNPPVPPVMTDKLKKVYNPVKVTKQSRLSVTLSILLLLMSIAIFALWISFYLCDAMEFLYMLSFVVFSPFLLCIFILTITARIVGVRYIIAKNLLNHSRLVFAEVILVISIIFFLMPIHFFDYEVFSDYGSYDYAVMVSGYRYSLFINLLSTALCIYMFIKNLFAIKAIKCFQKQSSLKSNLVNDLNAQYAKYHSVVSSFCIYKHDKRRYDKAKEGKTSAAVIWIELHKAAVLSVAAILLVAIILISVLVPIFTNKFRIGVAEKIQLGHTRDAVVQILGEPDESISDNSIWLYYDGNYKDILKRLDENGKAYEEAIASGNENKLLQLMNEEKNLYEKLDNLTYRYIEIGFEVSKDNGSRSSDDVEYVFFDAERCETKPSEKTVKKYSVLTETYSISDKKIVYRTYFTDGSYYSAYAQPVVKDKHGTYVELIWSDKFYNEYKADLKMY